MTNPARMTNPAILLLADSRLPTGAHAHSGGLEMAVHNGQIRDIHDLELFLAARVRTTALVQASFAAAAVLLCDRDVPPSEDVPDRASPHPERPNWPDWQAWDHALSARTPSAALRTASKAQGAALLRTATRIWHTMALTELRTLGRPHQPLVLGAATAAADGTPLDAAALAVHHLIAGACSAAVRLLGLDPLAVAATQVALTPQANETAATATTAATRAVAVDDPALLPATGTIFPELLAAQHFQSDSTLFAS